MRTWMVWTEKRLEEDELRVFAESCGGYWNTVIGGEAVIERGESRVFVAVTPTAEDDAFPEDLEYAIGRLGRSPASMVSMRIGHYGESLALAREVAERLIAQWGGFLDLNEPLVNE